MAVVRKRQDDKNLKILREIVTTGGGNRECFDCGQKGPTYVNMTIGSFVCTRCSGVLRGLTPPHRVKSISMATFIPDEIEFVKAHGNDVCAKTWLGLWDPKRIIHQDQRELMIDKYERKRYYLEPASPLKSLTNVTKISSLGVGSNITPNNNVICNNNHKNLVDTNSNSNDMKTIFATLAPPTSLRLPNANNSITNQQMITNNNNNSYIRQQNVNNNTNRQNNFQQQFTPDDNNFFPENGTKTYNGNNTQNINGLTNGINSQQNGFSTMYNHHRQFVPANNKNSLNIATTNGVGGVVNNFTPDSAEFVADFGSASIFNAPKCNNGVGPTMNGLNNGSGVKAPPPSNRANSHHRNGTSRVTAAGILVNGNKNTNNNGETLTSNGNANANFADFDHAPIYNAAASYQHAANIYNTAATTSNNNNTFFNNFNNTGSRYATIGIQNENNNYANIFYNNNNSAAAIPNNSFNNSNCLSSNPSYTRSSTVQSFNCNGNNFNMTKLEPSSTYGENKTNNFNSSSAQRNLWQQFQLPYFNNSAPPTANNNFFFDGTANDSCSVGGDGGPFRINSTCTTNQQTVVPAPLSNSTYEGIFSTGNVDVFNSNNNSSIDQNHWSLPMPVNSTGSNPLSSSSATQFNTKNAFIKRSSSGQAPSADRYAALKDLDEQLRENKVTAETFNAQAQSAAAPTTVNPFKVSSQPQQQQNNTILAANPFQTSNGGGGGVSNINNSHTSLFATPATTMFGSEPNLSHGFTNGYNTSSSSVNYMNGGVANNDSTSCGFGGGNNFSFVGNGIASGYQNENAFGGNNQNGGFQSIANGSIVSSNQRNPFTTNSLNSNNPFL